jgi:hypothetical protein
MATLLKTFFPAEATRPRGLALAAPLLVATALLGAARSLVHLFAPDSGAGSIAGVDLAAAGPLGASGIVFFLAQWGGGQLIEAAFQLAVGLRYRGLVPLAWLLVLSEVLLRMLVGHLKPLAFTHTPPGAVGNWFFLAVSSAVVVACLWAEAAASKSGGQAL